MTEARKIEFFICEFIQDQRDFSYTCDTPPLFKFKNNLPITLPLTINYNNKNVIAPCQLFIEACYQVRGIAEIPPSDFKYYPSLKFIIVAETVTAARKAIVTGAALCRGSMQSLKEQLKCGRAKILS